MTLLDGKQIFRLMDSHGMPFDLINDMMRERRVGFDVPAFLRAAHASKNYSKKRIVAWCNLHARGEAVAETMACIDRVWV